MVALHLNFPCKGKREILVEFTGIESSLPPYCVLRSSMVNPDPLLHAIGSVVWENVLRHISALLQHLASTPRSASLASLKSGY